MFPSLAPIYIFLLFIIHKPNVYIYRQKYKKKQDSQGKTERILPSCKQDIGESLSAYLQAIFNITQVTFKCK